MMIYKAFYKGKNIEVEAETTYKAQLLAAQIFKAKKRYDVSIILCGDSQGKQIPYTVTN